METLIAIIAPVLTAFLMAVMTIGIILLKNWVNSRIKSQDLKDAIEQVSESAISTVSELESTVRPMLSDGKLSKAEQAEIKSKALASVNAQVPKALKALSDAGIKEMNKFVSGKIERAHQDAKNKKENKPTPS